MDKSYYVYFHCKPATGEIFYVGKGKDGRAWRETYRNPYWMAVRRKYGLEVKIIHQGLTTEEACELEIKEIERIGLENLCNLTKGGDGMYGYTPSEETRLKWSIQRRGRLHTQESRQKMSIFRKGRPKSREHVKNQAESMRGRSFTEEHRRKLSESLKKVNFNPEWGVRSGKARMKKVFCLNNSEIYESTKSAAKELGLDSGSISRVCTGKYKHTKGYIFRYLDDENSRTDK